jgi:hypothetical protein
MILFNQQTPYSDHFAGVGKMIAGGKGAVQVTIGKIAVFKTVPGANDAQR